MILFKKDSQSVVLGSAWVCISNKLSCDGQTLIHGAARHGINHTSFHFVHLLMPLSTLPFTTLPCGETLRCTTWCICEVAQICLNLIKLLVKLFKMYRWQEEKNVTFEAVFFDSFLITTRVTCHMYWMRIPPPQRRVHTQRRVEERECLVLSQCNHTFQCVSIDCY